MDSIVLAAAFKWNNELLCESFLTVYDPGEFGSE